MRSVRNLFPSTGSEFHYDDIIIIIIIILTSCT